MELSLQLVGAEPVVIEDSKAEAFVCVYRAVVPLKDLSKLPFVFAARVD